MRVVIGGGKALNSKDKETAFELAMENGIITEYGKFVDKSGSPVIDAKGCYILPGLIDMNCDVRDPGYENIEDLTTASKSAAKGGFTTITCQPGTNPVVDNKTVVHYIISRSQKLSIVNTFVYGSMTVGCEGDKISEIGEMVNAGIVALSDGGRSICDSNLMRNIMRYSSMFNIPIITKCEDNLLAKDGVVNQGKVATAYGLKGIPTEAEEIIIARNIALANYSGSKLHISSVSTKGSVNLIRNAKKEGSLVTCETHPHYFTLDETFVEGFNTFAKVKPPLRTKEDIEAIKEALCDGTIDVISSGHTPQSFESKNMEFDSASFGISSLETAFSISFDALVASGLMNISDLVDKFSANPAKILGFESKGKIKEGYDADLFIFDPNEEYIINPVNFASKAKYSPYSGYCVKGKVKSTLVDGQEVYLD